MEYPIKAKFKEFPLNDNYKSSDTVIVPTVKGSFALKYGKHAYYFYNFDKRKAYCVEISHWNIIKPGLSLFFESLNKKNSLFARIKSVFKRFHYGFSFIEQIMLLTVPHTVTSLGNGLFYINLWSYIGYIEIDCNSKTIKYLRRKNQKTDYILGSQQWIDKSTNEVYYITYSLPNSLKKIKEVYHPVKAEVLKENLLSGKTDEVWSGLLTDYLHDITINKTKQHCVVCELGMFQDNDNTIPSKVLVIDMKNKSHWVISKFIVAAHSQFDPEDPNIIYFSNHNFKFIPTSFITLLRSEIYSLKFTVPSAVYKYIITDN